MNDFFWDIKEQEREQERKIRQHLAAIEAQMQVVQRTQAMRNAPGFADFLKSIEALRGIVQHKLAVGTLTNDEMREQRGMLRGVSEVLALLTSQKALDQLAEQRQEAQNALNDALKRRPKPPPEPASIP